jgi:hypothetical protein
MSATYALCRNDEAAGMVNLAVRNRENDKETML